MDPKTTKAESGNPLNTSTGTPSIPLDATEMKPGDWANFLNAPGTFRVTGSMPRNIAHELKVGTVDVCNPGRVTVRTNFSDGSCCQSMYFKDPLDLRDIMRENAGKFSTHPDATLYSFKIFSADDRLKEGTRPELVEFGQPREEGGFSAIGSLADKEHIIKIHDLLATLWDQSRHAPQVIGECMTTATKLGCAIKYWDTRQ